MPLQPVNLDDRRFEELLDDALVRVKQQAPGWTDLSHGDPGRVLLELFSHLTEVMIYRLNRLPVKVYVECLRLLGVQRYAPTSAVTTLEFTLEKPLKRDVELARGTRVAAARSDTGNEAPVFTTSEPAVIRAGETVVQVLAHHCEWVDAELLGIGDSSGAQRFRVSRESIIAPTGDSLDLVVGVETEQDNASSSNATLRRYNDKTYRVWRAVEHFGEVRDKYVYVADRQDGSISFGPALRDAERDATDVEVPGVGREVRVWYRSGGGPTGNLAANMLTQLLDPIPNTPLTVTNVRPAVGGREAEPIEQAWSRGPRELHSLNRAVTAEDFRLLALNSGGAVNRAYAYNKHEQWRYATRGTVEVICMPHVHQNAEADGRITPDIIEANKSDEVLDQVSRALAAKRPLGTHCHARWGRLKKVSVKARVVIFREEDAQAVRERVMQRLHDLINPLEREEQTGWRFGQPLSTYDVYRILNSEPGVKYVDPVRLCLDEVPSKDVTALCADAFQPHTWYSASGDGVFRSLNNGEGWEQVARIKGGEVRQLMAYPREAAGVASRAGLIAAITQFDEGKSRVHLSRDCGESWEEIGARPKFPIDGMAWKDNSDGEPALLLATEKGLYELAIEPDAEPIAILVDDKHVDLGFWGVAVSTDVWGQTCVAVAARNRGGVYLSTEGGRPGTYEHIGLKDEKVREIAVQHDGPNRYLWTGAEAVGDDPGEGCARWQLPHSPKGWVRFSKGWSAGGCLALAFDGPKVLAGTRRHGLVTLDPAASKPAWSPPDVQCGLPMQTLERMEAVDFVAAGDTESATVMTAGVAGIHRQLENAVFEHCSQVEFSDRVTLPATWLFCSGEHDIEVTEDAADRD